MSQALFLTSFRHLKINEEIDEYIEIIPGINITNNRNLFEKLLTPELVQGIGLLEFNYLLSAPNIVFGEYDDDDLKDKEDHPEALLMAIILWIEGLFRNAWLIKDHAMECDAAFLHFNYNDSRSQLFSNYLREDECGVIILGCGDRHNTHRKNSVVNPKAFTARIFLRYN